MIGGGVDWRPETRPIKQHTRKIVLNLGKKVAPLMMPGSDAWDVAIASELGMFSSETQAIFVERCPVIFQSLKKSLEKRLGKTGCVSLVLNQELHQLNPMPHPVDFVWIDLLGNLVKKDVCWIRDVLSQNLLPSVDMAFTFSVRSRGNDFIRQCMTMLETQFRSYCSDTSSSIRNFGLDPKHIRIAVAHITLIKYVLPKFHFYINGCHYKERDVNQNKPGHTMFLYRLNQFSKVDKHQLDDELVRALDGLVANFVTSNLISERQPMAIDRSSEDVFQAMVEADDPKSSAGVKAKATRWLNEFVEQRAATGLSPTMVRAGFKARLTRLRNKK